MREFVYLDEVSLTSLLVSQHHTIPEQITSGHTVSEQGEFAAKAAINAVGAKAESSTRYQTANSSSVESSRKAVVQTLFNELRDDMDLPISLRDGVLGPTLLQEDPTESESADIYGWGVGDLPRGDLIEVEVVLEVDPAFKLVTMVSEYSAMARENPQMAGPSGLTILDEIEPIKKVLDRLLAGLIPIRARACNFAVVTIGAQDYIVSSGLAAGLGSEVRPLEIVGVTEHIGYWKDIRRVLFSSGTFKVLCRIARPGLHVTWTPVKVAHLFSDIAPDLVKQIDDLGRNGTSPNHDLQSRDQAPPPLLTALATYAEDISAATGTDSNMVGLVELLEIVVRTSSESSPASQRQAFAEVRDLVAKRNPGIELHPTRDLEARRKARALAGLPIFPNDGTISAANSTSADTPEESTSGDPARLVDVEVVAIYW